MIYDENLHELGCGLMNPGNDIFRPDPILQNIVHQYNVITKDQACHPGHNWYLLPDNSAHLIFYLFEGRNTIIPGWMVIGPRSKHKIINRHHRMFTFICTFRPGGLKTLIDIPVYELTDVPVNAADVVRNFDVDVFDQLTRCALRFDIPAFVQCLEDFLLRSATASNIHPALHGFYRKIRQQAACSPVRTVASELGYSERQLRNIIQDNIGHSPKMVHRIERFTESLRLTKQMNNWATIAHTSGYYDQSHMISDYLRLVGSSPERLLSW